MYLLLLVVSLGKVLERMGFFFGIERMLFCGRWGRYAFVPNQKSQLVRFVALQNIAQLVVFFIRKSRSFIFSIASVTFRTDGFHIN